jgi:large subunit ribosomal protein L16
MLMPTRVKYRKQQKGRIRGRTRRGYLLTFGEYGLKAYESGLVSDRQIEAARVAINRHMKRVGKMWIRLFPDKPITKKPAEVRMGGGKGAPDHWSAVVKRGRVLFEVSGCPEAVALEAFKLAGDKLPIHTKAIRRSDVGGVS